MWLYFNIVPYGTGVTMPHEGHNDPTEAQVRWQIATALGYGATGLLYFEWHPMGDGHPGLVMSVNGTAVPSPHYFQVRAEKTKRHRMNRFSDVFLIRQPIVCQARLRTNEWNVEPKRVSLRRNASTRGCSHSPRYSCTR